MLGHARRDLVLAVRGLSRVAIGANTAVYALRRLRQAPGFALVAVAMLALGIGATSRR